jgi:hypothetical protein
MASPAPPITLTGPVTWFGGPNDSSTGPITASGAPVSAGGIAVYNRATLGGWWELTFPNGRRLALRQTDIGPAPNAPSHAVLDVAYSSLALAGYNELTFPSGATIHARFIGFQAPGSHSHATGGVLGFLGKLAGNPFEGKNQVSPTELGIGPAELGKDIEQGAESVPILGPVLAGSKSVAEWLAHEGPVKAGLTLLIVLAGLLLVAYGAMVALRPRETALSPPRFPLVVPV